MNRSRVRFSQVAPLDSAVISGTFAFAFALGPCHSQARRRGQGFTGMNHKYGHDLGDRILREFAGRLKSRTRWTTLLVGRSVGWWWWWWLSRDCSRFPSGRPMHTTPTVCSVSRRLRFSIPRSRQPSKETHDARSRDPEARGTDGSDRHLRSAQWARAGGNLQPVAPPSQVMMILHLINLDQILPVYPTVEAACADDVA